ncbi:type II toxin-antitoxin system RelE/ParE family toxin [Kamptonema sp. UHCC 0994]|uniref:type II toxin-antitoxin system RelE/ParE family toxin n=1 Tax=Kamptonema sp. UHCC 0994 TaxID=3031329 RepID=UPI0023BAF36F|nr:type II toxin-antitoxin system RelE/ParE family toxin [Kamptonema sp. UHCC 0994]MDF0556696.1 type II toxin-antitoxin system RelE/ParE family toxin [Kamptonema sp. UHCC 0994]
MQSKATSIQVYFADQFQSNLRALSKKYRHIRSDVQPIIEQLQVGELPGNQISGIDDIVFKVRVKNSDIKKGKSAGYRLIYHVQIPTIIFLMTIYAKSEQVDISASEICRIISELPDVSNPEKTQDDE